MLKFYSGQEIFDSIELRKKLHSSMFFLHVNSSNAIIIYSKKKIYRYYLLLPSEWKNWDEKHKDRYVNTYIKPLKYCIIIINGDIAVAIDRVHDYSQKGSEFLCYMDDKNQHIRII